MTEHLLLANGREQTAGLDATIQRIYVFHHTLLLSMLVAVGTHQVISQTSNRSSALVNRMLKALPLGDIDQSNTHRTRRAVLDETLLSKARRPSRQGSSVQSRLPTSRPGYWRIGQAVLGAVLIGLLFDVRVTVGDGGKGRFVLLTVFVLLFPFLLPALLFFISLMLVPKLRPILRVVIFPVLLVVLWCSYAGAGRQLVASWREARRERDLMPGPLIQHRRRRRASRASSTDVPAEVLTMVQEHCITARVEENDAAHLDPCIICTDGYRPGQNTIRLPCLHAFHQDCCVRWLRQPRDDSALRCPQCNVDLWAVGTQVQRLASGEDIEPGTP
eukprot:gnl/TRDRNA2_/TRDRNA2_139956_c0_seq3.p1 gnl/TRDRNA2_/TRDRNA2_139956_c0~~gnl/TRDRNA2_/TRDRNA2_139956_c0_seq3.p1  ORF type:complete len:348 (+),score=20.22 gnl/TRDRNA2_/TRDRNA2_139956_c0_seq3:53-1045(+)